jgi:hypothetical protein
MRNPLKRYRYLLMPSRRDAEALPRDGRQNQVLTRMQPVAVELARAAQFA